MLPGLELGERGGWVAWTGHRDRMADSPELWELAREFCGDTWAHGGAVGFDMQVAGVAVLAGVRCRVLRPDYDRHGGRGALFVRNRELVRGARVLVACYDGRSGGGTLWTMREAERQGVPVRVVTPAGNWVLR